MGDCKARTPGAAASSATGLCSRVSGLPWEPGHSEGRGVIPETRWNGPCDQLLSPSATPQKRQTADNSLFLKIEPIGVETPTLESESHVPVPTRLHFRWVALGSLADFPVSQFPVGDEAGSMASTALSSWEDSMEENCKHEATPWKGILSGFFTLVNIPVLFMLPRGLAQMSS